MEKLSFEDELQNKEFLFEEPVLSVVIFSKVPIMADSARCCGPVAGFVSYAD